MPAYNANGHVVQAKELCWEENPGFQPAEEVMKDNSSMVRRVRQELKPRNAFKPDVYAHHTEYMPGTVLSSVQTVD